MIGHLNILILMQKGPSKIRTKELDGVNITSPHKETIMKWVNGEDQNDNRNPETKSVKSPETEEIEVEEDADWTYRFLIPTSVAIAVLVIIGNVIQYFRQVTRKRYKVIEK